MSPHTSASSHTAADCADVPDAARLELAAPAQLIAPTRAAFRLLGLQAVEDAAEARASAVRIDMSQVESIDSSGLGVLVLLYKRASERGLRVRLRGSSTHVLEMLELTRLRPLFDLA
jgi:ABC-type transporter Mla MlaB component